NEHAARDVRVMVVGNPANTNAMIASANAPDLPKERFTAMARLDHNRAIGMLAKKTNRLAADVKRMIVWGNHSPTMHPDLTHCTVGGTPALDLVSLDWAIDHMIPTVQRRGAAVIEARGASSAASAAGSVVDHVRDWFLGTPEGDWVSMSVHSDGSYGITEGLVYSFPVTCKNGEYQIVQGLEVTDFSKTRMRVTEKELLEEREVVADLL
ncbi:MAG: malate dehydrogenase, partial [Chromatiaceae bacterium]|nr:malate dehydrogenase [Chromatiaceae bacterium]